MLENCKAKFGSAHELVNKVPTDAKQTAQSWNRKHLQPVSTFYNVCNLLQYNLFSSKTTPNKPPKKLILSSHPICLNQPKNQNCHAKLPPVHPLSSHFYLKAERPKLVVRKQRQATKETFHSYIPAKTAAPEVPIGMNTSLNSTVVPKTKVPEPKRFSMFEVDIQELQLKVKPAKEDKYISPWSIN